MEEYHVDIEYAYALAKRLGLEIEFDSCTPGIELSDGKIVSFVDTFDNMGFLSEKKGEDKQKGGHFLG